MKKLVPLFYGILIASLILPAGVLAMPKAVLVPGVSKTAAAVPAVNVVVTMAHPSQVIVAVSTSASLSSPGCASVATAAGNFLQNAVNVNLNQPASCFTLSVAPQSKNITSISIQQPKIAVQIAIPQQQPMFSAPDLSPAPISPSWPTLPSFAFATFSIVVVFRRKLSNSLKISQGVKPNLTLQQLQMLRC